MKTWIVSLSLIFCSIAHAADAPPDWMKYSNPGETHKKLAEMEGKWEYISKWRMTADAKWEESKGKSKAKAILGGRYIQEEVSSKMGGQKFEGISITGYDLMKKEYQTVWLDNMSTSMMWSSGSMENDILKQSGTMSCPMTGDKERKFRTEMKIIDKDHHTFSMYMKDERGKEFKSMEIEYTRK